MCQTAGDGEMATITEVEERSHGKVHRELAMTNNSFCLSTSSKDGQRAKVAPQPRNSRGRTAKLLTVVGLAFAYLAGAQSTTPTPTPVQTVLVVLTTREIRLSQTTLVPGPVRFVIVNQTPRPDVSVLVTPTASGKPDAAQAITPFNLTGGRRVSMDMTLSEGSFQLWLSQSPSTISNFTVRSGSAQ
jgi:hypothetical protein